jgi:hypothetical protein
VKKHLTIKDLCELMIFKIDPRLPEWCKRDDFIEVRRIIYDAASTIDVTLENEDGTINAIFDRRALVALQRMFADWELYLSPLTELASGEEARLLIGAGEDWKERPIYYFLACRLKRGG